MQVPIRNHKGGGKTDITRVIVIALGWFLIVSLARDVWQMKNGFGRIAESKERLLLEEKKNEDLRLRLKEVQTDEYKEKMIREKLNMQKQDEVVVILPEGLTRGISEMNEIENKEKIENWEKWWNLIK